MTVNPSHERVTPVKPAVAYIGGKRNLSKDLIQLIQATPHDVYAEAFVGMGGVFFRRTVVPKSEVINDASRDVATFFRILQRHFPQFMDVLKFQLTSRTEFERLSHTDPDTLTDLERAARFLYLQALSYGGKVAGRTFGVDPTRSGRFIATNADHPKVRDAFKGCEIREVGVTYTAGGRGNSKQMGELIIIGGGDH